MTASSQDRSSLIAEPRQRVASETATGVVARWEQRLKQVALVLARLGLAYLFFTQLWWKALPTYGCPADFHFTTGTPSQLQRSGGLCDWIGIESVYATQPHRLLVANIDNRGAPEIAIDIGWLARLNGVFIDTIVKPNIRWFGSVIFFTEAFIFASLFLGLLSRLGGLVAIGMSAQLLVGLAGIPNPYEWEWAYINMVLLAVAVFAFAPGRILGLDRLLRPRLQVAAANGSRIAKVVFALT
jgi:TQO small subunit DoxD